MSERPGEKIARMREPKILSRIFNLCSLLARCEDYPSAFKLFVSSMIRVVLHDLVSGTSWAHLIVPSCPRLKIRVHLTDGTFTGRLVSYDLAPYYTVFMNRAYERIPGFSASPGWVLIDVGAHSGMYTVSQGRRLSERGKIYSFEPDPVLFQLLAKNVSSNDLTRVVETYPYAISNRDGEVEFILEGPWSVNNHVLESYPTKFRKSRTITVKSLSLDTFVQEQKIDSIDCLKIDVEGSELEVLNGGVHYALRRTRRIVMEYHGPHLRDQAVKLCSSLGFTVKGELPQNRILYLERGSSE